MGALSGQDYSVEPCRNHCKADLPICTGCGRSTHERLIWNGLTIEEKKLRVKIIEREGLRHE